LPNGKHILDKFDPMKNIELIYLEKLLKIKTEQYLSAEATFGTKALVINDHDEKPFELKVEQSKANG
jgi:hypothetical protein